MRRLLSAIAALALVVSVTGNSAQAGPLQDGYVGPHFSYLPGNGVGNPTIIVGSGNGVGNTIGVQNRGGVGNPTIIVNSANGAYNSIGVQNRGGVGNRTVIRDSANGAYNSIDVRNKGFRPGPYGPNGLRHQGHWQHPGFGR